MKNTHKAIMAMISSGAMVSVASADVYQWDWSADVNGTSGLNMNGGEFESVHAQFDSNTDRFLWEVTFADQISDGYTLAVNNGPNPKGHAGELALIYFDATGTEARVTGYAYNGVNSLNSFRDGSPIGGTQAPDILFTSDALGASPFIMQASMQDVGLGRVMTLEIDASLINVHNPQYPGPEGPSEWSGLAFDELLGLWMHPMSNLTTSYNEDGSLDSWSGRQGWFDSNNWETTTVPAPGALALLGFGGVLVGRRRK